ncbi:hypothetical protein A2U01_0056958, partial [Trifolium medium]|nr:hypothetical protein [Trifolium medium]
LLEQVKELKEKVAELEEKMKSAEVTLIAEEEREADPAGLYAEFSRADLIQLLNPNVDFKLDGLDEEKEVRDGRIATPPKGDN